MANILGQIMVVLGANTASFEAGMNAADKLAQRTGKNIERAFEDLGSKAESILGSLGPMAGQFSTALSGIGTTARSVLGELGPLAGAIGPAGVAIAGVAAVGAGAAVALTAIAAHAAEADARLGELSKSTGVAVEQLSLLGDVASTKGIGLDQMATALERMSRSAFTAAQAAPTARNAYTQLGIAVTDASGQMRSAQAIFNDVSQKFAAMADGPQKTALAIQIFGRAGAALIPLLDEGGAKISELEGHFEKLGAVVSGPLAAASEQLKENEALIGAAFKGIENQIASDLLPALNAIAEDFIRTGENGRSAIETIVHAVDVGVKAVIGLGDDLIHIFEQIGIVIEGIGGELIAFFNAIGAAGEAAFKLSIGDWGGAKKAAHEGLAGVTQEFNNFWDASKKNWSDNSKFWHQLFSPLPPADKNTLPGGPEIEPAAAKGADRAERIYQTLLAQTNAQLALAAATGQSVAAQKLQEASGQADEIISKMLEAAHGNLTKKLQEEIATVHALTAERQVAKDAIQINQELEKETEAYQRQINSIREIAEAYAKGGSAVGDALIDKQLEADKQKVAQLTEEYTRLQAAADQYTSGKSKLGAASGPVQGIQGIDPQKMAELKTALDNANASLAEHRRQLEQIRAATYDEEISKENDALRTEQPLLDQLNAAYGKNAQAVRQAQVALALYHWEQAHPGATPEQIQAVNVQLEQQSINAQRSADAQLAARYNIGRSYDDEIAKLERAKEVLQSYGQSTLEIDAAIYDERQRALKQWDDAAFKVGDFRDKYQAVMNEVALKGEEASQKMAQAWLGAIDSVNTELAKMLTGQKFDFKKIVLQLAQEQTKGELEKAEGWLAQQFGIKVPGLEGKPDGSSSKPLHVTFGSQTNGSTSANPLDAAKQIDPLLKQFSSGGDGFFSKIASFFHSHQSSQEKNKEILKVIVGNIVPTMVTNWPQGGSLSGNAGGPSNPLYTVTSTSSGTPVGASAGAANSSTGASVGAPSPQYSAFLAKQLGIQGGINWKNPEANITDIDRDYEASLHTPFGLASQVPFGGPQPIGSNWNMFNASTNAGAAANNGFGIGSGATAGRSDVGAQALSKAGTDLDKAAQPLTKAGSDADKAAQSLSKSASDLSSAAQSLKSSGGGAGASTPSGSFGGGGDSSSAGDSSAPDFSGFDFGGGLASGGPVKPGTHYMVGEKGPELFRSSTAGSVISNSDLNSASGPHNWTFDPHAAYAQPYERYERWLHRDQTGGGGFWKSLGLLGGEFLLKKSGLLDKLFHHGPSAASTATSAGGAGTLEGGGSGFGIGADANPNFASFGPASVPDGSSTPSFAGFGLGSDAPSIPPMTTVPDQQTQSYINLSLDGFRASGGPVNAGATYMVGEKGPELFHAPHNGHIIPNHMISGFRADGGDVFSGNSYMVGERGPEMYQAPGVSNVSNSSRGGDTHNHNITQNNYGHNEGSDLFGRTAHQKLKRLSHP